MSVNPLPLTAAFVGLVATTPALAQGAIAAAAKAPPAKISDSANLQVKQGYWVECDAVGENCYYVYSFTHALANGDPAPGAQLRRLDASAIVQRKGGYWVDCDTTGTCNYLPKAAKKK